ncbi:DUF721 domain-containing protein [Gallaecimonas sp. GXIMD1310]|uniref:DUF721 domain-containing protein n=1 Tax=Gallaecimonas sp. GXIMD1310 TaxID=3131926 RepID=UPI003251E258
MSEQPSNLEDLMQQSLSGLASLSRKARQLAALQQHLEKVLPAPLSGHCRVANLRGGILVLETGSAAWLSQLRLQRTLLLSQMRQMLPSLTSIDLRINPACNKAAPNVIATPRPNPRKISAGAAASLLALADEAPPALQRSLKRLAALSERRKEEGSTD